MTIVSKLAIAAVLVAAAGSPALAQGWGYYGEPYAYTDGYYGGRVYSSYPYYGDSYAYVGDPYYGRRWYGPRYRYAPATSDFAHRSRQLQGTR